MMKVRDAMAKTISTVAPTEPIKKVAQVMKQEDTGFVPVIQDGRILGVITDRDIVVRCLAGGHRDVLNEFVQDCMSTDVKTIEADADLEQAAQVMNRHEIRRLPVLERDRLVGILSHGNLVQATRSEGPADEATL